MKEEIIKCKGNCYFKFCVVAVDRFLRINKQGCELYKECRPFVNWANDKEEKIFWQEPFTKTSVEKRFSLAQK